MPRFKYRAINGSGEQQSSEADASSDSELIQDLSAKGLTVLNLTVISGGASLEDGNQSEGDEEKSFFAKLDAGVPVAILLHFYEQIGFLMGSGIPLHLSIRMVFDNIKHPGLQAIIKKILFDLSEGSPFSESLAKHGSVFPPLHVHVIGVGEKTGKLDQSLLQIVDLTKERIEIERQAISAASYPLFLIGITMVLALGMVLLIFPQFKEIFGSFQMKLPFLTQVLMDLSDILRTKLILVLLGVGGSVFGTIYMFKSEAMSETRENAALATPIVSRIFMAMFVSQFSKTVGSTLKSGIPLLDALIICRRTLPHGPRYDFLTELINGVREGLTMSAVMERTQFVPELVWQLSAIGEQAGNLNAIMDNIFTFYKRQYNEDIVKISGLLKSGMMFFAAAIVGSIAGALFIPLFKMGANMKKGG